MKIIAKKGTAFEETVKIMCKKIAEGYNGALDMVERTIGIKPKGVYHIHHWGTISLLVPEFVFDTEDSENINPKFLREKMGTKDVWVPASRYKEGKQFKVNFQKFANEYNVEEEPLHEFGIHMVDWKNGISYYIYPIHDIASDRYMLVCSDSIPKGFDKEKLKSEQFDIEY